MGFLLDTGVLIHAGRKSPAFKAIDAAFHLSAGGFLPLVSVVSVGEVRAFVTMKGWGQNKVRALDAFVSNLTVLPIDLGLVVDHYAELQVASYQKGRNVGQNDLWIAATAVAFNLRLLTFDGDFARLPSSLSFAQFDDKTGQTVSQRP